MTVNEAMLIVAEREAKKYGYIEVSKDVLDARNDSFWGNKYVGLMSKDPVTINRCRYIYPIFEEERDKNKMQPSIKIDMYYGRPRLNVCKPDGTFTCITYKDNVCSETQTFKENGLELALEIKKQIDELLSR